MSEIWKDIEDYEGLYQVSNLGNIKSLQKTKLNNTIVKEHLLKQYKNHNGYNRVLLFNKGKYKNYMVHRLVASAFIKNELELPSINHIDGNKQNNKVENLEWCSYKDNIKHSWKMGLSKPHKTRIS